ncbi:MAG: EpsI family protein [Pseudomonadales bacterium]
MTSSSPVSLPLSIHLHWLIFLLSLLVLTFLYHSTAEDILFVWTGSENTDYSHGLLLFFASVVILLLAWRRAPMSLRYSWSGALAVAVLSLIWLLSGLVNVMVAQQLAFLLMIPALFWALYGWSRLKTLLIPLSLPICAVPIWDILNQGQLQVLTASAVRLYMELLGFSVLQDGVVLQVPAGTFRVAENCSGMRQIVVAIPLCLISAYLNGFRWWASVVYACLGIVLAILVNTIRILIVVVSGYLTEMQHYFVTDDHISLGWVLFVVFMGAFLYLTARLPQGIAARMTVPERLHDREQSAAPAQERKAVSGLALLLLAICLGPALQIVLGPGSFTDSDARAIQDPVQVPVVVTDWIRDSGSLYQPRFAMPERYISATYLGPEGEEVYLNGGAYYVQTQGREAVSSEHELAPVNQWSYAEPATSLLVDEHGLTDVRELIVQSSAGERVIVWAWYQVDGRATSHDLTAKLMELEQRLLGGDGVLFLTVATPYSGDRKAARGRLVTFWSQARDAVTEALALLE